MKNEVNPAAQWLQRAPGLKIRLDNLLERIDHDGLTPRTEKEAEALDAELTAMESAIDSLENPYQQLVLIHRYLYGPPGRLNPWRQVAMELYKDDGSAAMTRLSRLHYEAVRNITVPEQFAV